MSKKVDEKCDILWAVNDGGVVVAAGGETEGPFHCLGCYGKLVYRKAHVRKRKRNGLERVGTVRAHFAHHRSRPATCTGETIAHRAAKRVIALTRPRVLFCCVSCDQCFPLDYDGGGEWIGKEELRHEQFVLDVGFIDAEETVKGAIEVFKTHRIPNEKAKQLTEGDLAWGEVDAQAVLETVLKGGDIKALRCAVDMCEKCSEREERIRLQEEHALVVQTAKQEAWIRVRATRPVADLQCVLDDMQARLKQEATARTKCIQEEVTTDVLLALERIRAQKTKPPLEEEVTSTVKSLLMAPPDATKWGRYPFLSPTQVARRDTSYFVRTLCALPSFRNQGVSVIPRADRVGEKLMQAARLERHRLQICIDCYKHHATTGTCYQCTRCWEAYLQSLRR